MVTVVPSALTPVPETSAPSSLNITAAESDSSYPTSMSSASMPASAAVTTAALSALFLSDTLLPVSAQPAMLMTAIAAAKAANLFILSFFMEFPPFH